MSQYISTAARLTLFLIAALCIYTFLSWIPPRHDPEFRRQQQMKAEAEQWMRDHLDEIKSIDLEKSRQEYIKRKAEYDAMKSKQNSD